MVKYFNCAAEAGVDNTHVCASFVPNVQFTNLDKSQTFRAKMPREGNVPDKSPVKISSIKQMSKNMSKVNVKNILKNNCCDK